MKSKKKKEKEKQYFFTCSRPQAFQKALLK